MVEERLVKLERSAARWRWAAGCLALLLGMTACVGMAKTGPEQASVLSAQMFKVVNDQGATVAAISSRDNGDGVFVLHNRAGKPMVIIGSLDGDGSVTTMSATGDTLINMAAAPHGEGVVEAYGRDGRIKATWPMPRRADPMFDAD